MSWTELARTLQTTDLEVFIGSGLVQMIAIKRYVELFRATIFSHTKVSHGS
jgi:hypothetical protein